MTTATAGDAPPQAAAEAPALGDGEERLRVLFETELDFVWRTVRRLGVAQGELEDAVQQVFVVVSRRIDEIRPGHERSFLYGTARRVAADHRRKWASSREDLIDGVRDVGDRADPRGMSPAELLSRKQARALLQQVLDGMPMQMREVFMLFELEGMTMIEVARTLELAQGTVASRLRRARELFHEAAARLEARYNFEGGRS